MAPCVRHGEMALEVRAPNRIRPGVLAQPLAIRRAVATTAAGTHEAALPEDVADGACHGPRPVGLAPSEDHQQFPWAPAWMTPPQGHDGVDDRRGYRVGMRPRRTRAIHEGADAALFVALDPLVTGLATDAGVLAQRREGLLVLKIPRDELHTFIHGISLMPWHATACRGLSPMSSVQYVTDVAGTDPIFLLTRFHRWSG